MYKEIYIHFSGWDLTPLSNVSLSFVYTLLHISHYHHSNFKEDYPSKQLDSYNMGAWLVGELTCGWNDIKSFIILYSQRWSKKRARERKWNLEIASWSSNIYCHLRIPNPCLPLKRKCSMMDTDHCHTFLRPYTNLAYHFSLLCTLSYIFHALSHFPVFLTENVSKVRDTEAFDRTHTYTSNGFVCVVSAG